MLTKGENRILQGILSRKSRIIFIFIVILAAFLLYIDYKVRINQLNNELARSKRTCEQLSSAVARMETKTKLEKKLQRWLIGSYVNEKMRTETSENLIFLLRTSLMNLGVIALLLLTFLNSRIYGEIIKKLYEENEMLKKGNSPVPK